MSVTLALGGVVFADFEIPDAINSGGQQMLAVHKLPGGQRVIDALGPDDSDISWAGRFRGANAEERAILLDYMRRQGQPVTLSYSLHRYQVVIREFHASFQYGGLEIPYSIACTVVLDETQSLTSTAVGFIESLAADLAAATGLSDLVGSGTIAGAVTGIGAAISNYQSGVPTATNAITGLTSASEATLLAGITAAISSAQTAAQASIAGTTVNPAPVSAGGDPATMGASLSGSASALSGLNNLYQLSATLSRMGKNVANR